MNKVILMGRLTRDPEVRYSQGERPVAVARYTLAVNRTFKRAGEPDADFINCVTFGRSAEFAEKYFRQGIRIVAVSYTHLDVYKRQAVEDFMNPGNMSFRWSRGFTDLTKRLSQRIH